MADERIDILNDNLTVIKTCLKSEAHKNGWLHPTVHIWFYTDEGEILIQKRAKDKSSFPDLWDVSVAGHIGAGEEVINAAIRQVEEEIALSVDANDLNKIGVFKENFEHGTEYKDNEIHHIYLCKLVEGISSLKIQKEELSEIRLISLDTLERDIEKINDSIALVPHYPDYYSFVLNEIKKELSL